jgi:GrpB-like predicted nucleotidyltransferase (UPF0157 family)
MVSADPVAVVPYDDAWPSLYEEERARIERAIGPWAEGIEHVGSTAVPGLAAKPVIDIMVGVKSLDDSSILVERLVGIGYEYVPEFERVLPFRRYFRKMREGRRTHQIHLVERSNTEWWDRHLLFRDYLPRWAPSRATVPLQFRSPTPTRLPTRRSAAEPYFLPKDGWLPRWHAPALAIGWSVKYPSARKEMPDENQ